MCSTTFSKVQHIADELGCVELEGMDYVHLRLMRLPWFLACGCVGMVCEGLKSR